MTKLCFRCKIEQELDQFNKKTSKKDGLDTYCKKCSKILRYNKRQNNLEEFRKTNLKKMAERIKWIQDIKRDRPCLDCGKIFLPYCMDFDHVPERGKKIKSISRMVKENAPKERILQEIEKCDLVCVLCHNKRTRERTVEKFGPERRANKIILKNVDIINNFKDKPCVICGEKYPAYNMQCNHIDPSLKIMDICQMKSYKTETLLQELAKCEVICALCHRKKSIEEQDDKIYCVERKLPSIKKEKCFYDEENNLKQCFTCREIKSTDLFYKKRKTKSKFDSNCKKCTENSKRFKRINKRRSKRLREPRF